MKFSIAVGLALSALVASPELVSAADCGACKGCLWTYSTGFQCFTNAVKESCDAWGPGYTWCTGDGSNPPPTPSPTPTPTPTPTSTPPTSPTPSPPSTPLPGPSSLIFSPYIDLGLYRSWQIPDRMNAAGLDTITLAFATGECGSESWAGRPVSEIVGYVDALVAAKKKYIISTGGAAGSFHCGTDANFIKFINRYSSDYLVGIDFDIEVGQTQESIDALVLRAKNAHNAFPHLRFSFTMATFGQSKGGDNLNPTGAKIMSSIKAQGLTSYLINLMAMDFGRASPDVCVVANGECDMGLSANQAAINLHNFYGVPLNQIELTVMIGGNDVQSNVFRIEDVRDVTTYAKTNGLAGVHIWSLDRDVDCVQDWASPICNSYGKAGELGFSKEFVKQLA